MCKDSLRLKRILIGVCLLLLLMSNKLHCQVSIESLPSYLNTSSAGTEFYITTIPYYYADFGMMHFRTIHIACDRITEVTIENESFGYKHTIFTKANEVISFELSRFEANPEIFDHHYALPLPEKVYSKSATRISSKSPIVVSYFSIDNYRGESYLAIPISAYGKEYVVNSFNSGFNYDSIPNVHSSVSIIAAFDNTKVFYNLVGDGKTETVGGQKVSETRQYTLNIGDIVSINSRTGKGTSFTGSIIHSNKPIGVITGHPMVSIPTKEFGFDNYVMEMELPIYTWGKEYHIPRNFQRNKGPAIQVVAKEPNTKVFINGVEVGIIDTLPNATFANFLGFNTDGSSWIGSDANMVVSADKPIAVTMFNQSFNIDSTNQYPFQMSLSPICQYKKHIVFSSILSHFYRFTNLVNVIVPLDENKKIPSDVEWGELVSDTVKWTPFAEKWGDSVQTYFGTQNGKKYGITNITLYKIGMYQIRANEPMMAYLYGQSTTESFGFPAFVGLKDVTKIDTIPPKFNFLVNNYVGEVTGLNGVGSPTIQDMPEDGDSRTNLGFVFERTEYTVNFEMTINEFVPGEDRITTFQPSVIDKSKDAQIVITAIDRAGNDTTIVLTYKPINTSVIEELSAEFLKVTPSITNNEPITIKISNAGENLSIVSIDGRTIHTFENLSKVAGSETIHFETTSIPIGMYYVLYSVNGKQYQQSFVKMK